MALSKKKTSKKAPAPELSLELTKEENNALAIFRDVSSSRKARAYRTPLEGETLRALGVAAAKVGGLPAPWCGNIIEELARQHEGRLPGRLVELIVNLILEGRERIRLEREKE